MPRSFFHNPGSVDRVHDSVGVLSDLPAALNHARQIAQDIVDGSVLPEGWASWCVDIIDESGKVLATADFLPGTGRHGSATAIE